MRAGGERQARGARAATHNVAVVGADDLVAQLVCVVVVIVVVAVVCLSHIHGR